MIYSRDRHRGFYWFAPAKDPASSGPPPIAFDRDVLGDKEAFKAAKRAAADVYRATDGKSSRLKVYGSDFLSPGYVTSGDGTYFHPAWGNPPGWDDLDVVVAEIASTLRAMAEDAAAEGEMMAFNIEGIKRDVIRVKVLRASYDPDDEVDERFAAAVTVRNRLREQLEDANSEAETEALTGHYEEAEARYEHELGRLIDERGLSETVESVAFRLSGHFTSDPDSAIR